MVSILTRIEKLLIAVGIAIALLGLADGLVPYYKWAYVRLSLFL